MKEVGNWLFINDIKHRFFAKPLDQYWELKGSRPGFTFSSSPLDIGYHAAWTILDNKLWLLDFVGETFLTGDVISFESQFPGNVLPLLAGWFSGTAEIQTGKVVYEHDHFGSTLEKTTSMKFQLGVLVETTVHNTI